MITNRSIRSNHREKCSEFLPFSFRSKSAKATTGICGRWKCRRCGNKCDERTCQPTTHCRTQNTVNVNGKTRNENSISGEAWKGKPQSSVKPLELEIKGKTSARSPEQRIMQRKIWLLYTGRIKIIVHRPTF